MPDSVAPNTQLEQIRDFLDAAEGDKASPEQLAAIEKFLGDNPNPSDADLRFEVMRALRVRFRRIKPANRDSKVSALRELLTVVEASDEDRAKRLGVDIRDELIHSGFYSDDVKSQFTFLEETVARYDVEADAYFRPKVAYAKYILTMYILDQSEVFKDACKKFIQEYIGDADDTTAYMVLGMAYTLVDSFRVGGGGVVDGVRPLPANEKDRVEALAVCDMMLARYGADASARIQEMLQYIKEQRLDLVNDPKEIRTNVEAELDKLLDNPDKFPGLAYAMLGQLARAEGRRPFDVFHDWCDKILQRPLSDGMAATVRAFRNFALSGRECPDDAALQSEYDAAEELIRLYADSTDPKALTQVIFAMAILPKTRSTQYVTKYIDVLLAKPNILSLDNSANLLFYKIDMAETVEEKLRWIDKILALPERTDKWGFYLEHTKKIALFRKAELLNNPQFRREYYQEAISGGASPGKIYNECMDLLRTETDPAERGIILDQAIAAFRAAGEDHDTCGDTQYFIQLLTLKADGMRDATAAMPLYREALAAMERWDRNSRRWCLHLDTLEGMLRLTPQKQKKAALYDRFIELADSAERYGPIADELRLQKAALLFEPSAREEIFATIISSYAERRSQSRERIENMSKALLAWLSDCTAAGRDPNYRDGVTPTSEGETPANARNKHLTKRITELDAYPASGVWREDIGKHIYSCVSAMWMVKEMVDPEKIRAVCGLVTQLYGGQFDHHIIKATLAARALL